MSVTPELVKSKLASLDVTQESIVSVSSCMTLTRPRSKLMAHRVALS